MCQNTKYCIFHSWQQLGCDWTAHTPWLVGVGGGRDDGGGGGGDGRGDGGWWVVPNKYHVLLLTVRYFN